MAIGLGGRRSGVSRALTGLHRGIYIPMNRPRGPRFKRFPFDQRITPLAQRGDVNVDPVVPPINGFRVVPKSGLLFGWQRGREYLYIGRIEHMLVVQDERLVQLDE